MNKKEIIKPAVILTVICFVVAGLLALTNYITADKIAKAKADSIAEAMESLVPGAEFSEIKENSYSATENGRSSALCFHNRRNGR